MSGRPGGGGKKVLLPPINLIFKLMQTRVTVQVWLFENLGIRVEGKLNGFDEHMNLVITNAVEVKVDPQEGQTARRELGQILLKGDNVCLIQSLDT